MNSIVIAPAYLLRGGPLFWHVMDRIDRDGVFHPEQGMDGAPSTRWYQGNWRVLCGRNRCATGLCLAGYICEVTGSRWLVTADAAGKLLVAGKEITPEESYAWLHLLLAEPDDLVDELEPRCGHVTVTAAQRARRLLGIDHAEADELFNGGNTKTRLNDLGVDLFGPRPAA